MTTYNTDIVLGERYRDEQTGMEGYATAICFFQHGCERATLEVVNKGEIKDYGFDAPRLVNIETGKLSVTTKTGGPRDSVARASLPTR